MTDHTALLRALCQALAAEEAHAHQPVRAGQEKAYCAEGWQLREDVRRLRRAAERALREETAA
jgi:hypothetical protein